MSPLRQISERAAQIDALLTQLGGRGSNLREKAASLAGQLSARSIGDIQQLDYLRENAVQGGLSDLEAERFQSLSDSVMDELQHLRRTPDASYVPAGAASPVTPAPTPSAWDTPASGAGWDAGASPPNLNSGIPEKLRYITIPLLILLALQVLGLLFMPFMGPIINSVFNAAVTDPTSGIEVSDLGILRMFTGATLWIAWLATALWAALLYFTWKAIQQGKSWARVATIVIAVLGLMNFPIGTILSIFMLIGAFDRDVQRFASR